MKHWFPLTITLTIVGLPALAAPCKTGTLASYIAMTSGCSLGGLQATAFKYNAASSGGASKITPDQITVTPLLTPATATVGFQFAASWGATTGQDQASKISYHIASPSAARQVDQLALNGSGFTGGLITDTSVTEVVAEAATTSALNVFEKCKEKCNSKTSASATIHPTGVLALVDKVSLKSTNGSTGITSFTDLFVMCLPCTR